jgi:hypothetical protein
MTALPVRAAEPEATRAGPDWWSLQAVRRPAVPVIRNPQSAIRNPIDAFVLAGLEANGLRPNPPADRATLLRRATFDLTGLPPTPAEIDAFVNARSPDAWEKVIDRLLASPRYGERWGRHWLDVARFGESNGYERDQIRDHAWRYRDYVIRAFNEDKPYPQFVKEQLAGDVLPGGDVSATGFLVCGPWDQVAATAPSPGVRARGREEELEDILGTVAQGFLGLTVNCARCHDHKFDPVPQADYYRLKAAFDGVRFGDRPLSSAGDAEAARVNGRIAELERTLAALDETARAKVGPDGRPAPLLRWSFEKEGGAPGTLHGGAVVENGRLRLDGKTASLEAPPLPRAVREKTLEAWASPANLSQRGGGVISLETKDGGVFDAVVLGEREPGRWIAGSDFFRRTRDLGAAAETAGPGELVHVAVVYSADNRIALYRNGVAYGAAYTPAGDAALRTYPAADARVLIGKRHTGGGNAFFAGEVAEARLYDRALTAAEVAASFRAGPGKAPPDALTPEQRRQRDELLRELSALRESLRVRTQTAALAWAAVSSTPGPTHVLIRGDVEKPGERVGAAGLSVVRAPSPDLGLALDAPEGQQRLKFAEWVADPRNPLTARVLVNRVWHWHFGQGIVRTPSDLGFNGDRPSHPELLDWLASEFVRSSPLPASGRGTGGEEWGSVKRLHRLILTSATYQQSSAFNAEAAASDADNRLLWRFAPRRIEGEAVRDALLFVSGRLNEDMGGPGFRPFTVKIFNSHFYTLTDPLTREFDRRTVYRIAVHSAKSPLLDAFDCPDPSTKTPRRAATTTPLQALALMNNAFVLRQASHFADRLRREAGDNPEAQVVAAYRLAFGRTPTKEETARAAALVREHGADSLCWVLLNASEFLYVR